MSRLRLLCGLLTLALWLAASGAALAAAGDLDPTFGAGGKAVVGLGAPAAATSVALQPDGRIIVGGYEQGIGTTLDGVVARILLPQGILDPSYAGGTGWSRIDFGGFDSVGDVALQSDGRIVAVVADFSAAGTQSFVVRLLNPGGTTDPAFGASAGTPGFVHPTLLPFENLSTLVVQADDRIVVAGDGSEAPPAPAGSEITVARLLSTGPLDPSYGGGAGWSRVNFPMASGGGVNDEARAVALQPDGRIVVAGLTDAGLKDRDDFAVARLLNPGGGFDPSFGPAANGNLRLDVGGGSAVSAIAVQPDGRIVLAGSASVAGRAPRPWRACCRRAFRIRPSPTTGRSPSARGAVRRSARSPYSRTARSWQRETPHPPTGNRTCS